MTYASEYSQPLTRTTHVQCPVLSGYVTARLRVMGEPTISVSGFADNTTLVSLTNTGNNAVGLRLQGTDDYTSGPREWVGAAQTLVPQGHVAYSVTPRHTYLEVAGQSGTSTVSMQLSSRLKWAELGFDGSDLYYPAGLYTAKSPLTGAV